MPRRRRLRPEYYRLSDEPTQDAYNEGYEDGYRAGMQVAPWEKRRPKPGAPFKAKKKRRKTAYQSAYSAAYKRLKKKHPRMSFGSLSKKAHAAARKKVK